MIALVSASSVLGAGLVLAAQDSGRADRYAVPTDRERVPTWIPGSDIPMMTYLGGGKELPLLPPR